MLKKAHLDDLVKAFNFLAQGHVGKYLAELKNGGLDRLCKQAVETAHKLLDALYAGLQRLKRRLPDRLNSLGDRITALLHALDQTQRQVESMFRHLFDELGENLNLALGKKRDLDSIIIIFGWGGKSNQ